jgi:hypothetical protein
MSGNGFTRGVTGRADLVRARRLGDPELEQDLAELLGYQLDAPKPVPIEPGAETTDDAMPAAPDLAPTSAVVTHGIPFWQATSVAGHK